ncbi:MAG: hypothetical protein AB7V50_09165 [Vampirovibrionia bacterium]
MRLTPGNMNQTNTLIQPQTQIPLNFKASDLQSMAKKTDSVSFGSSEAKNYENPVNRKMEIGLEVMQSGLLSSLVGVVGAAVAKGLKANNKVALIAGLVTAGVSAIMTIPGSFYNAKVKSFVRSKDMDVYSRTNSVEKNISEKIDVKANDPQVPLEDTIDNFLKFNVGRKGNANFFATV